MALGKLSEEGITAPSSVDDDATLDIVRLLIEAETRHSVAHPERQAGATVGAGVEPATAPVAPRRVTLRGQPKLRGESFSCAAHDEGDIAAPRPERNVEDLRPRRLGLRWPRFTPLAKFSGLFGRPQQGERKAKLDIGAIRKYGKLAMLMVLGLIVLFKPWLIPVVLFISVWLSLIVFLLLGSSRISELIESAWEMYQARRPGSAARIMGRLQNAADRLDGILARLPARFADGVFTPDLGRSERDMALENVQLPQNDPFERLVIRQDPAE